MYQVLKVLHLLGLTLFLGSIFGHIAAGVAGGAVGSPQFLEARLQIDLATRALTLPGLGLALATGVGLAWLTRARRPWLAAHASLAGLLSLLAGVVVVPAGRAALAAAQALARGEGDVGLVHGPLMTEHVAGAANIALTLAVVALGVFKPALRALARRQES